MDNASQKKGFELEHKEIGLIFSLFVFVSLLMFTVGILVGKGLTQAKYEKQLIVQKIDSLPTQPVPSKGLPAQPEATIVKTATEPNETKEAVTPPVAWIPQKKELPPQSSQESLLEPQKVPTDEILKNPGLKGVIEEPSRSVTSVPRGLSEGDYTVQIGSYANQKDATARVEQLKKLGFSNAFFSAKQMEQSQETWFRVWLGYFSDFKSADAAGKYLKEQNEVKQYLVKKSDSER